MSLSLFSLEGKIALVTGSGQGIGLALAEGLTEAGARHLGAQLSGLRRVAATGLRRLAAL